MKKIIPVLIGALIIAACGKDKFQTKPQIRIISSSSEFIPVGSSLQVVLEYTDKEGDVNDSLIIVKQRINQRVSPTLFDTIVYEIPEFPERPKGQFEILIDYDFGLKSAVSPYRIPGSNPAQYEPDSLNLKFVVTDAAGNTSDTATLSNIVVERRQ